MIKNCLTIAGSDCSGGAGIQADLKTFSACGCYGMSVVVCVVAENTSRVLSIHDVPASVVKDQIDAVFEDIAVDSVKIGMLPSTQIMETVAERLRFYKPAWVVTDPVMAATQGAALMRTEALNTLKKAILPLSHVVTPNLPEAEMLLGRRIGTVDQMKAAARDIHALGPAHVLIKGGHLPDEATDVLFDGKGFHLFAAPRIASNSTHGTGCTMSSAMAAQLARGASVVEAVGTAKSYVARAIASGLPIGRGHGPTNHFYEYYQWKGWLV